MKSMKLVAAAATAAALVGLAPGASPADAAPAHPPAGTTLLCTLHYDEPASRWYLTSEVSGSCTSLSNLDTWTVTNGPWGAGPLGDQPSCPIGGQLSMVMGGASYRFGWEPSLGVVSTINSMAPLGLMTTPHPEVAIGALTDSTGRAVGMATLVGAVSVCDYFGGYHTEGTMVATITVGDPVPAP